MKKIILFTFLAFALTSCLPRDFQIPQSPLLSTLERKSGLIAYIGTDGNIYVSDQGGGKLSQLSNDAVVAESQSGVNRYYELPSWSRDGNQLAFVRRNSSGGQVTSDLMVANIDDDSVKDVYTSNTEHPFYLYWAPDNRNVSFLSTTVSNGSLVLQSVPSTGGDKVIIDSGSPYYWSWAPDGKVMIVHTGGVNSSTPEHLAFLQMGTEIIEDRLDSDPASFQAPAWSMDGSRILFPRINDDDKKELVLADSSGTFQEAIDVFDINVAFAWSNDSNYFAYITGDAEMSSGTLGTLHVMDLTGGAEDIFQDENVVAFFWSPDSTKLAYFKPFLSEASSENDSGTSGQTLSLELSVFDLSTGESNELFSFVPTQQFLNILPYFDQYHQSVTIWSPDNNNLVLSFTNENQKPSIAIIAASGKLQPRVLADGYLAFWSWK